METFSWPVRVYYEDTDNGGVVYYANYLKFMERARTEWLRHLGFEQDQLVKNENVIFAVRSAKIEYLRPAVFNDLLHVSAKVIAHGRASITFAQEVVRDLMGPILPDAGEDAPAQAPSALCLGEIKIACLDVQTMRPTPIPVRLLAELTQ